MQQIKTGIKHRVTKDIRHILISNKNLIEKWNNLTPIARNEWICWITIVKKPETQKKHLIRFKEDILKGKKKPCCWPGCPHRNLNSKKWFS